MSIHSPVQAVTADDFVDERLQPFRIRSARLRRRRLLDLALAAAGVDADGAPARAAQASILPDPSADVLVHVPYRYRRIVAHVADRLGSQHRVRRADRPAAAVEDDEQ